jgi:hypothetical protein
MGAKIPLGQRESLKLEFKAAAALKEPSIVSRGVVAMLNARGGEIWIGLREEKGIAVEVEGCSDPERAKSELLDHLLEAVEPRLRDDEVAIDLVFHEERALLRVRVKARSKQRPFAQVRKGARYFAIRVDHRIRPMTREEIFAHPVEHRMVASRLESLRDETLKRDRPGLWVGIEPKPSLSIDVRAKEIEDLLRDPARSGNRMSGLNFRYSPVLGVEPRLAARRIELGKDRSRKTSIWDDGLIEFWTPLEGLHRGTHAALEIFPLALLEYPVSIMRLATSIYRQSPPDEVLTDVALVRAEGWHLRAFAPGTMGYVMEHEPRREPEDRTFLLPSPLRFGWDEFQEHPDHAGYMLVRAIYQAFGLPEDRIPSQYDRILKRLVLPE